MLTALLTDIDGAGRGFDRGFVTYTKESKTDLLGDRAGAARPQDAVSEVVARVMAEGALKRSKADLALGITGFAGPAGSDHEEGLVHMALARRNGRTMHREQHFGPIGRGAIRVKSLKAMLDMLEQALEEE